MPGCTSTAQCVLPNAIIPAVRGRLRRSSLLQYIPTPNAGDGAFSTGAFAQTVRDDKGSLRIDGNSRLGLLSGYYFVDDYRLDNPYPGAAGRRQRARVRRADDRARATAGDRRQQSAQLRHSSTNPISATCATPTTSARRRAASASPIASQGFVTGPGTPGIVVQAPQFEGVENVAFEKFVFGVTTTNVESGEQHLPLERQRLEGRRRAYPARSAASSSTRRSTSIPTRSSTARFSFQGTETGSDFADFLLGAPSGYIQAAGTPFFICATSTPGAFAQDSWRARPNLTLNYGLR